RPDAEGEFAVLAGSSEGGRTREAVRELRLSPGIQIGFAFYVHGVTPAGSGDRQADRYEVTPTDEARALEFLHAVPAALQAFRYVGADRAFTQSSYRLGTKGG